MRFASRTGLSTGLATILAIAALAAPAQAKAQDAAPQSAGGSEEGSPADETGNDNEIIVTAQHRSQRLQDVPIAISAFSGDQLSSQGITTSRDLTQIAPGLIMTETNSNVQPFIRGVGSTTQIPGEVGSVAIYVDGVYQPSVVGLVFELANIESLEVLKGPQGTLYGRNALGGAINVNTKAPSFSPEGSFEVSYGRFNELSLRHYVSGPLSDKIAVSFAGNFKRRDGYFNDLFRGEKVHDLVGYGARAKLLFEASDDLSITLAADYDYRDDPIGTLQAPINGYRGKTATSIDRQGPYDYIADIYPSQRLRNYGFSGRIEYDLGGVKLMSLSAYRAFSAVSQIEADTTPFRVSFFNNDEHGNVFSQELQLTSDNSGPLNWIAGLYYADQISGYRPLVVNDVTTINLPVNAKVYAAFADATYKLGDFELTGGVRYNYEKKHYTGTLNGNLVVDRAEKSWESVTPRAIISYHPSRDLLVYASYSAGFKSGAFNTSAFSTRPLNPEKVDAYELGLKLSSGRLLTLNASAFWYDNTDIQLQTMSPVTNLPELTNAAKLRTKGVDLDLTLRPSSALYLRAGVAYLDAKFVSFPNAQIFVPAPPVTPGVPDSGGNLSQKVDATGNRNVRSPEWTFNLAASYTIDLPDGGSIVPSANLFHATSFFYEYGNRIVQPAYTVVNAELNWRLPGDSVSIGIWAKNLFDERYFLSVTPNAFADRAVYAEPRTYGVRVGAKF